MLGDMSYPEWLITIVQDAVPLGTTDSERVLDALGFRPEYRNWKAHDRVHADTEVWEGYGEAPEYKERRRKALEEMFALEDEMEARNADPNGTDSSPSN